MRHNEYKTLDRVLQPFYVGKHTWLLRRPRQTLKQLLLVKNTIKLVNKERLKREPTIVHLFAKEVMQEHAPFCLHNNMKTRHLIGINAYFNSLLLFQIRMTKPHFPWISLLRFWWLHSLHPGSRGGVGVSPRKECEGGSVAVWRKMAKTFERENPRWED